MKNLQILLCLTCLVFIAEVLNAQDESKSHSIGIQLNPYLDSNLSPGIFNNPVFAGRYSMKLNKHFSIGPEVSGFFVNRNAGNMDLHISRINIGGFIRYSLFPDARIRPFVELSPYYTFYHFDSKTIVTQNGIGMKYNKNYFSGYLSPGITLYSRNRKVSLDLMYKFSNNYFTNNKKSIFTYRLNFNF
jgi:hypothetical protein